MPSIKEKLEKSKHLVRYLQNARVFAGVCCVLVIVAIFGSFKLAHLLEAKNAVVQVTKADFSTNLSGKEGAYVGSKKGKTYYFPWCGTVNRIKDANLVWFPNRAVAESKGYQPSSNCHGLK
jgi:hypothetical protein